MNRNKSTISRELKRNTEQENKVYFPATRSEELEKAVELINHRPRKSLDYQTPFEVFFAVTSEVALQI
jgi:IS30 family transposase